MVGDASDGALGDGIGDMGNSAVSMAKGLTQMALATATAGTTESATGSAIRANPQYDPFAYLTRFLFSVSCISVCIMHYYVQVHVHISDHLHLEHICCEHIRAFPCSNRWF